MLTVFLFFVVVVLVVVVCCCFFLQFSHFIMCLNIKMHNIKRPEFRVTFKFSNSSLKASTAAITFIYILLFFLFRPQFWLVTVFLVGARLILKTPPVI